MTEKKLRKYVKESIREHYDEIFDGKEIIQEGRDGLWCDVCDYYRQSLKGRDESYGELAIITEIIEEELKTADE